MAFVRAKKREPVGEAGFVEYAVGAVSRRMRTERDLRRLMKARAEEGEAGGRAMDAVVARLKELGYLSDERFAEGYTRVRKESEKLGRRRVQQDLMMKGVGKELVASTLETAYASPATPIASSSTVTLTAWTVPGIQPCINEVWCSANTGNARFAVEPVTLSIVVRIAGFEHEFHSSVAQAVFGALRGFVTAASRAGRAASPGCCGR